MFFDLPLLPRSERLPFFTAGTWEGDAAIGLSEIVFAKMESNTSRSSQPSTYVLPSSASTKLTAGS
ncbi:MAG: hypothetical protein IPL17_17930 [Anaerolineales bacterium]|nr:hypothetical protein [Anaerolineales bacterium]